MDKLADRLKKMTPLQKAVFALKETKAKLQALEQKRAEPIAVVGMACRFPGGADDGASYWQLLCDGVNAIREVPPERWDVDAYYDEDPSAPGKTNTRWGGFIDNVDLFDNHFFGISQREAERIDPQHRLVLELAWEAMEDAGLPPSSVRGSRTGVFIGLSHSEYGIMLSTDMNQTDAFVSTGTAHCIAANRISFLMDFCGPSVTLDTACSSSLVTVHLACQSIRNGESDLALAGGVNIILSPLATVNLTKAGFSAPDGQVRAFDADATGYVRGEGAGMVVLKPLAAALKDKDPIYAVIRGSAVNQNGWSNGLSAPSSQAQSQALRAAYEQAKRSPGNVQYVETQGTGTRLGDAIEAMALGEVVSEDRPSGNRCHIGSVKTNIGHLEAASGVASLMKVSLAIKHGQLPPSRNFKTPNPDIPFDKLPLKVQQKLEPWPESSESRLAGVSAFGFGGSNAHVVLEEPPAEKESSDDSPDQPPGMRLLPLSARTDKALLALAKKYVEFLRNDPPAWDNICYTAADRRDHHDCRLAVLADSPRQAAEILDGFLSEQSAADAIPGRKPYGRDLKTAFIYDGQSGPDWQSGLQCLADVAPGLAEASEEVDAALQAAAGFDLATAVDDEKLWDDRARAVPATVALQLALTAWWRSAGMKPDVVLGRSAGELAAACVAGILTMEDALKIAAAIGGGKGRAAVKELKHNSAKLPLLSALDGQAHNGRKLKSGHWLDCLDKTDGLDTALDALKQRRVDVCVQMGPDTLCESLESRVAREGEPVVAVPSVGQADGDGGLALALGRLYAAGVDFKFKPVVPTGGRHVPVPKYPWQKHRIWAERKGWLAGTPEAATTAIPDDHGVAAAAGDSLGAGPEEIRERPDMNTPYTPAKTDLERSMVQAWTDILRVEPVGIHDNFFELGGDSLQAMMLHNQLQEQLGEVVLGYVLFQAQTIDDLAAYLRRYYAPAVLRLYPDEEVGGDDESGPPTMTSVGTDEVVLVRRLADQFAPVPKFPTPDAPKNPQAIFLLSPPRSGSTLLRVMLAGHDRLFSPPELELLSYGTMADRKAAYGNIPAQWLEGVVRTVMEVRDCSVEEAREFMGHCEESATTTQEFYRMLQERLGDRLLIDKTPSYPGRVEVLRRAEELFDEPLYIHLLRHPCAMVKSYVDYRMHEAFMMRFGVNMPNPFTPEQMAELSWVVSHENILQHLATVPPERRHRLRFEDVVREPEQTMKSLCDFLGFEYQPEMIHPYDHPEQKMLDGVVPEDRMYGDQKFMVKHKAIDPAVADAWKEHLSSAFLGEPARKLAAEFGYEDLEPPASPPTAAGIGEMDHAPIAIQSRGEELEEMLAGLDSLSDEEVTAKLGELADSESEND